MQSVSIQKYRRPFKILNAVTYDHFGYALASLPLPPGDEIYGCGRVLSGLHNNVFKFSYIVVGVKKILKH